jgi:phosphoserine aminotransferase
MKASRVYNFGAGPAMLPQAVMEQAQAELLDWHGCGMSTIEMSHRSKDFKSIAEEAERDLRDLMNIPDHYRVLFLQGGATAQFAMAPLNLLGPDDTAAYLHTGNWSGKAIKEAKKFANIHVAASSEADNFSTIPEVETWDIGDNAKYLYFTSNETVGGVEFQVYPHSGGIPLVCDATSNFLTRRVTLEKYGAIFAGAQKNFGPAGIAVVVIRDDLIGHAREGIPTLYDYATHRDSGCMYNTPPTFSWYLCGLMFKWIKEQGGIQAMENMAVERSGLMYQVIDESGFYHSPVNPRYRSRVNVPFTLPSEDLEQRFLDEAREAGLVTLEGHRSVGGLRASFYNGMPYEGVVALTDFMKDFEKRYG